MPRNFVAFLFAILFLCSVGISQAPVQKNQPSANGQLERVKDEYRVYEALINEWFGKANLNLIVIDPSLDSCKGAATMVDPKYSKIPKTITDDIETDCVDLQGDALLDLSRFNLKQKIVPLTREQEKSFFPADVDCEVGWKNYFKKYPRSNGYTSVSRVGFDRERRYAAVYFSYIRACLDGEGHKVLLENVDGQWKVIYKVPIWMV